MHQYPPEMASLVEEAAAAFEADDAGRVRAILERAPALKALLDQPVGPFDSPPIVNVRSRAMLDVLLDAGANINGRSRWWAGGFGLLDSASPEVAAYAIERGAALDAHAAARLGMLNVLQDLVTRDPAVVHARGGDGQTPLHFARTADVAIYLLDQGADIDARDVDHESTPAQYMVGDRQDVARLLVSRGCRTDILMAAALGDIEVTRRHLDADPDCIRTRVNDVFFPKANRRAGGTIYQWTLGFHVSAHDVARKFGRREVLGLLTERTPPDLELIDACWAGHEARVRRLRETLGNVAARLSASDRELVAHAARNNQTDAVRLMLESGWPVDARGQHHATPLHWAAFHGNAGMAEVIVRFMPALELTDADFNATPLGWTIHGLEHGWHARTGDYAGVVDVLLRAGATRPTAIAGSPAVRRALSR